MYSKPALLSLIPLALIPLSLSQSTTTSSSLPSTSGLPDCALQCTLQDVTSSACSSVTNETCLCTDSNFQATVFACYEQNCDSADVAAAEAYGSALCSSLGVPINTASPLPSVSSSASSNGSSSSSSTTGGTSTVRGTTTTTTTSTSSRSSTSATSSKTSSSASTTASGSTGSTSGAGMLGGLGREVWVIFGGLVAGLAVLA